MAETPHKKLDLYCKFIVAFVALASFLIFHQVDITSRHFAVAFNIPAQNISIYFDKLYSLRCLCSAIGYLIEYSLYQTGGGDRNGKNEGVRVRKFVGIISFSLVLIVRTAFLAILYISNQLSYHVYLILWFEAPFYSIHEQSFMGLAPEYISILNLMFNLDRFFIQFVQFILDLIFYSRPILMIKIQVWICVIITASAVGLWWYYNFVLKPELVLLKSSSSEPEQGGEDKGADAVNKDVENICTLNHGFEIVSTDIGIQDKDGVDAVVVPFVLYLGTVWEEFLYPGTLPYALLHKDRCHSINMLIPLFINTGPIFHFIIDSLGLMNRWEWYYNLFLSLVIPLPILFVFSMLAIHTQIPSTLRIRNSFPRVMIMTLTMKFCHGNLEPLAYVGIGKYAARGNPYGHTVQVIFNTTVLLSRTIFSRLSTAYTDTRVSLGYHLPKFRPNHKMSNFNTFWYIFRQTGRRSWRDLKGDFKFNIKKYL